MRLVPQLVLYLTFPSLYARIEEEKRVPVCYVLLQVVVLIRPKFIPSPIHLFSGDDILMKK